MTLRSNAIVHAMTAVDQLAAALEEVEAGASRSAAFSLTLPAPLVAALRALVDEGVVPQRIRSGERGASPLGA